MKYISYQHICYYHFLGFIHTGKFHTRVIISPTPVLRAPVPVGSEAAASEINREGSTGRVAPWRPSKNRPVHRCRAP